MQKDFHTSVGAAHAARLAYKPKGPQWTVADFAVKCGMSTNRMRILVMGSGLTPTARERSRTSGAGAGGRVFRYSYTELVRWFATLPPETIEAARSGK